MSERIVRIFDDEAAGVASALIDQLPEHSPRNGLHALQLIARSGYSVGFEIGLGVGIADSTSARRIQRWFASRVQQSDPLALEARDRQIANWLRAVRGDA